MVILVLRQAITYIGIKIWEMITVFQSKLMVRISSMFVFPKLMLYFTSSYTSLWKFELVIICFERKFIIFLGYFRKFLNFDENFKT